MPAVKRLAPLGLALALLAPASALAQTESELAAEIEELRKGQEEIRQEIRELRGLLEQPPARPARPAGPDVAGQVFDLGDNPVKGAASARLTLIEFTDYQ